MTDCETQSKSPRLHTNAKPTSKTAKKTPKSSIDAKRQGAGRGGNLARMTCGSFASWYRRRWNPQLAYTLFAQPG